MLRFVLAFLLTSLSWLAAASTPLQPARADAPTTLFLPLQARVANTAAAARVHIVAFLPDGLASQDMDETVVIQNTGDAWLTLKGWRLTDGEGAVILPDLPLAPREFAWCAYNARAFRQEWGRDADCEYGADSDPGIPNATGQAPRLSNSGDELQLLAPDERVVDAAAFAGGDASIEGWQGDAVNYYSRGTRFAREGQIFYRLFDPLTLLPLSDTDSAADWAQGNLDPARGRRAAYPGWELLRFSQAAHVSREASNPFSAQFLVAPDNMFGPVRDLLANAQSSIYLETYEINHPDLVDVLVERAQAGVEVKLLLEGSPVGGLSDESRWVGQRITEAGGQVDFMVNDIEGAHDRYPSQHAKFIIVDGQTLFVGTENFKASSMPPSSDTSDGQTQGRRGYGVILTEPTLVARGLAIFQDDDDPAHPDIFTWRADHPQYGLPPSGYKPPTTSNQSGYAVRYPQPYTAPDVTEGYLFTSPESSLTPGPLLDLLAQAGAGDEILVQQLYEHPFWGATDSNPTDDPNPRLEALIAAARRGARVRLLLDGFFDDPEAKRSNAGTAAYVNQVAQDEGLDLEAKVGNPTLGGIHAKIHLLSLGNERWVSLGSMNGGEVSNKLNREMAVALQSSGAHAYLSSVFWSDWAAPVQRLSTGVPDFPQE
ncbi:MAG: hypothetical protein GXP42_09315 [Chloroflexi bacterium]|nr:hypothetical protein [Chloroflexota bacterium]